MAQDSAAGAPPATLTFCGRLGNLFDSFLRNSLHTREFRPQGGGVAAANQ